MIGFGLSLIFIGSGSSIRFIEDGRIGGVAVINGVIFDSIFGVGSLREVWLGFESEVESLIEVWIGFESGVASLREEVGIGFEREVESLVLRVIGIGFEWEIESLLSVVVWIGFESGVVGTLAEVGINPFVIDALIVLVSVLE